MISQSKIDSLKPYSFQFVGRVIPQLLGLGISSIVVTSAGVDTFGQYAMMLALITIVFSVLGTSLDTAFQRSCDKSLVYSVISSKIGLCLIILPFILSIAALSDFDLLAMTCVLGAVLILQLTETSVVLYRIEGKDVKSILPRLLPVLSFFLLLYLFQPRDILDVGVSYLCCWALSGCWFLNSLLKRVSVSLKKLYENLKSIYPIWISLIFTQGYGNVDLYIINVFYSDEIVGIYKIAYTFASLSLPIAGVFSFIFLSNVSAAIKRGSWKEVTSLLRNQFLIISSLGLALIIFTQLIFVYVAQFLYGLSGVDAVHPAQVLAIAMTFNMLMMVFSYILLALHKEKLIAILTALGGVAYLVLSWFLIPEYAALGAAYSMLIVYILLFLVYARICHKMLRDNQTRECSTAK